MSLESVGVKLDGFRSALSAFASSVNVISMWDDDNKPLGMTATAFSSVSADPALVLVCVNRSTRTFEHITKRRKFGINILGSVARDISDYCSRSGADKYLNEAWLSQNPDWQSPALSGSMAFLDCEIEQEIHAGTHVVLIGAVKAIGLNEHPQEGDPLIYFSGGYRPLQAKINYPRPELLPIMLDDASIMLEDVR